MSFSNPHYVAGAINKFARKYPELDDMTVVRCLYVQEHNFEVFIVETEFPKNNTIIFRYENGELVGINCERNTFNQYFDLIPSSHASEYHSFA